MLIDMKICLSSAAVSRSRASCPCGSPRWAPNRSHLPGPGASFFGVFERPPGRPNSKPHVSWHSEAGVWLPLRRVGGRQGCQALRCRPPRIPPLCGCRSRGSEGPCPSRWQQRSWSAQGMPAHRQESRAGPRVRVPRAGPDQGPGETAGKSHP